MYVSLPTYRYVYKYSKKPIHIKKQLGNITASFAKMSPTNQSAPSNQ